MRWMPHAKQHLFLLLDNVEEVFYGGAGGGGKSVALLLAALQYCDVPGYSALILRRTYPELSKSGALLDKAHELLMGVPDVWWNGQDKSYYFNTGPGSKPARLQFGYLETEKDKYQYQSAEFQFIAYDELTEFEETQYTFLFSRLRKTKEIDVPLRMRAASNPGGVGHDWVKARFPVDRPPKPEDPLFIPATISDNPSLDMEAYERSLDHLLLPDRQRIKEGRWDVIEGGTIFSMDWLAQHYIDGPPSNSYITIRWWDLAATTDKKNAATAGVRMSKTTDREIIIEHAIRDWLTPGRRDNLIKSQAEADGKRVNIGIEEEPGSGGIAQNDALFKQLMGWRVISERPEAAEGTSSVGGKFMRFGPFASYAERGFVKIVRGEWNVEFLSYLHRLTLEQKTQLDWMDACSGAFQWLSAQRVPSTTPKPPAPDDSEDWRRRFKDDSGKPLDWRRKLD